MAQPRFLFVAGVGRARVDWVPWPNGSAVPAEGRPEDAGPDDDAWVAWRLTSGNNRELGRSPVVFADLAGSRAAAALLQQHIDRAKPLTAVNDSTGLWGWRLELDGRPVAAAARLYLRQRECQYSLTQFLAAVPVARISDQVAYLNRDAHRATLPKPRTAELRTWAPARAARAMTGPPEPR